MGALDVVLFYDLVSFRGGESEGKIVAGVVGAVDHGPFVQAKAVKVGGVGGGVCEDGVDLGDCWFVCGEEGGYVCCGYPFVVVVVPPGGVGAGVVGVGESGADAGVPAVEVGDSDGVVLEQEVEDGVCGACFTTGEVVVGVAAGAVDVVGVLGAPFGFGEDVHAVGGVVLPPRLLLWVQSLKVPRYSSMRSSRVTTPTTWPWSRTWAMWADLWWRLWRARSRVSLTSMLWRGRISLRWTMALGG